MADEETEETIVAAVGTATGAMGITSADVERAMVAAIEQALSKGITDPDELRRVQLEARDRILAAEPPPPEAA